VSDDDPGLPPEEPVEVPIEDWIDLHHFHPSEILAVVDAYLDAAIDRGILEVRLVHGRGRGVQRARIRGLLERDPRVERFEEAPPGRGGWGATLAWLRDARLDGVQRIFVGDVQGCGDELEELLARARSSFGDRFEVWWVGDLVNRGPASLRALELAREYVDSGRGQMVLGNHEIGLLKVWAGLRRLRPTDTIAEVLESRDALGWIDWLRRRPLAIAADQGGQRFAIVHASVHPDWSLEDVAQAAHRVEARLAAPGREELRALLAADPSADAEADLLGRLTECRSVEPSGAWSSELPGEGRKPWHALWSERDHDYGVVYGHWALQGLHVARGLRGLDTGCVHHGRDHDGFLTAWLPGCEEAGAPRSHENVFDLPDECFWQVVARRQYYGLDPATSPAGPAGAPDDAVPDRDDVSKGSSQ